MTNNRLTSPFPFHKLFTIYCSIQPTNLAVYVKHIFSTYFSLSLSLSKFSGNFILSFIILLLLLLLLFSPICFFHFVNFCFFCLFLSFFCLEHFFCLFFFDFFSKYRIRYYCVFYCIRTQLNQFKVFYNCFSKNKKKTYIL